MLIVYVDLLCTQVWCHKDFLSTTILGPIVFWFPSMCDTCRLELMHNHRAKTHSNPSTTWENSRNGALIFAPNTVIGFLTRNFLAHCLYFYSQEKLDEIYADKFDKESNLKNCQSAKQDKDIILSKELASLGVTCSLCMRAQLNHTIHFFLLSLSIM